MADLKVVCECGGTLAYTRVKGMVTLRCDCGKALGLSADTYEYLSRHATDKPWTIQTIQEHLELAVQLHERRSAFIKKKVQ